MCFNALCRFLELFKRPLKSVSEPGGAVKASPLSPGRYSRVNVSVGKRHPLNKDRVQSLSSSSAENLNKVEDDDNPFDEAFIDALTMKERRRMDSMVGGTLQRRHSLPFLMSVDEGDEDAFEEGTDNPVASGKADDKPEPSRREPPIKVEKKFTRKRSCSLSELASSHADDSAPTPATGMSRKLSK